MKMRSLVLGALASLTLTLPLHAATIEGTIKFEGTPPKFQPINMAADPVCQKANPGAVMPESLVLGAGQTIGNVFVHLKSGVPAKEYPAPATAVTINQKGCHYDPHVLGVMKGQPVKFLNNDPTLHNVHVMPKKNPQQNVAMPATVKEKEIKFRTVEDLFPTKCDVHPWMQSYIAVMSHPYFAVTQKDGKFTIKNVPAGTYEVEAWQEKMGTQVSKITVTDADTKTVNFSFSAPTKTAQK